MLKRFLSKMDAKVSKNMLLKVIGVLLILFLLLKTEAYWGNWISIVQAILQPFVIGFVIAYVMHPFVKFLERKGVPKNFSIIVMWITLIVCLVTLIIILMPILYEKINEFMSNMIDGVVWISNQIKHIGEFEDFSLIDSITNNIIMMLKKYDDWIPQIVSTLPNIMSIVLDSVTNILFSIIIAIYMLFDFDRIRHNVKKGILIFAPKGDRYIREMDENVSVYMKSLIIIMLIKFIEYSAFYFLIGHPDWVIIGILTSLGAVIPYLGGTIANSIGIITALTLSPGRIIALLVGILILSNVDAYVISPLVHEKRSALGPLVTLFAVFAGGVLMGPIGIMISVPVTIIIKTFISIKYESLKEKTDCQ